MKVLVEGGERVEGKGDKRRIDKRKKKAMVEDGQGSGDLED